MTAINVVRCSDRLFVLTDGAMVDADGIMQEVGQKVEILPYLRTVLAFRGPVEMMAAVNLQVLAEFPRSFEDLLRVLPEAVEEAMSTIEARGRGEIVVAGISFERQRTESYLLFTEDNTIPSPDGSSERIELEAFTLGEAPALVAAPVPSLDLMAEFGLAQGFTPETFNPYVHGPALLQAQRRTPHSDGRGLFIGGMVNLNTITAAGVNSEIILTWPDKIGQKISPPCVSA